MIVLMCCNDDNGIHQTYADAIEFKSDEGETLLKLEDPIPCEFILVRKNGANTLWIRINKRRFPVVGYATWFGNMAWDAARVNTKVAEDIANYLLTLDKLQCVEGEASLFQDWEAKRPIYFPKVKES